MKNPKLIVSFCIIAGLGIICIPGVARADLYHGAWKPIQNNDFFIMSIDFDNSSHRILYIYDYDNWTSSLPVIEDMPLKNEYFWVDDFIKSSNLYQLISNDTDMTVVTTASPSPVTVPTAMLLLSSGLTGLVVIGRKIQR
jgi:hypothetical protein